MKTALSILICLIAMSLTACGADETKTFDMSESKEEVAKIAQPTEDYCDLYNWYGDGVCDEFCTRPDPDCGVNCLAYPSCGPDQVQVDSCAGLTDCESVTTCGSTIHCQDDATSCLSVAVTCGPDEVQVDRCDTDNPNCTRHTDGCNGDVYCLADPDQCAAVPVCPDDSRQVDACSGDVECFEVSMCGQTILCEQRFDTCEAYPGCQMGYVEVEQCPADASCYDETVCGYTITCMKDEGDFCRALPVCDEGDVEVSACPANATCYDRTACGQTITCAEQMATCLAIPVCDANEYQVSNQECASSLASCERASMCGQTIFCKDLPAVCPDAVGVPPSCPVGSTPTSHCSQVELDRGTCYAEFGTDDQCSSYTYCRF